jgi:hypothetical protein
VVYEGDIYFYNMYQKENKSLCGNLSTSSANTPWSVHAEFSIHRDDENATPIETISRKATITPNNESTGVRMSYSFIPNQTVPTFQTPKSTMTAQSTYDFQRGNLIFSSTPSSKLSLPIKTHTALKTIYPYDEQQFKFPTIKQIPYFDSNSNNEQLSGTHQLNNKRCKSTYNIVLSPVNKNNNLEMYQQYHTHSYLPYPKPWSTYCQQQNILPYYLVKGMAKIRKDCTKPSNNNKLFKTRFCTRLSNKNMIDTSLSKVTTKTNSKDAASQTIDIEAYNSLVTRRKSKRKTSGALTSSCGKVELKNNNVS